MRSGSQSDRVSFCWTVAVSMRPVGLAVDDRRTLDVLRAPVPQFWISVINERRAPTSPPIARSRSARSTRRKPPNAIAGRYDISTDSSERLGFEPPAWLGRTAKIQNISNDSVRLALGDACARQQCPHSSGQVARFPAGEHARPARTRSHGGMGSWRASQVPGLCCSRPLDAMLFDIDDAVSPD